METSENNKFIFNTSCIDPLCRCEKSHELSPASLHNTPRPSIIDIIHLNMRMVKIVGRNKHSELIIIDKFIQSQVRTLK